MHIAIDAHSVGANLGGNETYAINLIKALAEIDQTNRYTLYVTRQSAIDRLANRWPNFKVKQTLPHTPFVRIPITLTAELRQNPVDVLHVQYTAPPLTPCPIVATIHDLSFEHLPETFNRRSRAQLRLTVRRTARKAARILTLSEFSRRDIIETYRVDPACVSVTPAAAPPDFVSVTNEGELKRIREKYHLQDPYLLSLCSIQPRKNLVRLIEAYSSLRQLRPDSKLPQLVLAGRRGWLDSETFSAARRHAIDNDITFTGYIDDRDLPALYSGAICFVYPSFFEGFGLPVLEAMQCGVPVIAGNRTSLPEIVGEAGLLFDPFETNSLVAAMDRVLSDSDYRAGLREKGLARAGEFDWKRTAQLSLMAYEEAVQATRRKHVN